MKRTLIISCLAVIMPLAYADQGGFENSGGSLTGGSPVANPAGTLIISGNTLTFLTADSSTVVNATFTTNSTVENCSGGGKGGHVTCSYTFTGTFSGTLTAKGYTQAINGSTYQVYGTNGVVAFGNTGYNSSYTPLYFTDGNARILRSDDLSGANAIAYGTQGTGIGQFYGPSGFVVTIVGDPAVGVAVTHAPLPAAPLMEPVTVPDDPLPMEQPGPPVPPSRITRWLCGSQAISAPYRAGGLSTGPASDHPEPSQSQVPATTCPSPPVPPNMTTSPVAGSSAMAAPVRGAGPPSPEAASWRRPK